MGNEMPHEMPRKAPQSDRVELLSTRYRRLTVRILRDSAAPLPAIELARRIGEREYASLSSRDLRAIYLTLSHDHLPRLDEADVVEYDRDEGTVQPGPTFDDLSADLAAATAHTNLFPGDRCPRCDAAVKTRVEAAGYEQPVCLGCERELRGTSSVP